VIEQTSFVPLARREGSVVMSLSEACVRVQGVSKEFAGASLLTRVLTLGRDSRRQARALHDVSLDIGAGEIVGVLGPHGSGKSTLLRCIAGLVRPTSGVVTVAGRTPWGLATDIRGRIGWMPGLDAGFHNRLTGRENLELYAELHGRSDVAIATTVTEAMQEVALMAHADRAYALYTPGMRARLALARALLGRPSVLLLDELSPSLEPIVRDALHTSITRLAREQGVAVVMSTSDLTEAQYICDRLVVLDEGRVVAEGAYMDVEARAEALFRRDSTVELSGVG
jgi:ABC-2 type transport system ATP-binding protein